MHKDQPCADECVRYQERLNKYCHLSLIDLNTSLKGAREGVLSPSSSQFELVHAHVLVRHGDRSPSKAFNMGSKVFIECGLVDGRVNWNGLRDFPQPSPVTPNTAMLQSHLHLHPGSRSKNCGIGSLTNIGFMQQHSLGRLMSLRYSDLIVQDKRSISDIVSQLYVQSTDFSKTIQSAAAFLLGFLPDNPALRKATMIHVSPGSAGFLEAPPAGVSTAYLPCKNASKFQTQERQKVGYFNTERERYHPLLEKLCDMFYIHDKNLPIVTKVFDHVVTCGCHDRARPLPCSKDECVSYEFGNDLFAFADWSYATKFPLNSSIIAMMPFLKHSVLEIMDSVTDKSHPFKPKFMLSIAHDSTIMQVLNAIRLPIVHEWMPYASRLVFELWKEKDQPKHFVRILYNGQPITQLRYDFQQEFVEFSEWKNSLTTGNYRNNESYNSVCGNV